MNFNGVFNSHIICDIYARKTFALKFLGLKNFLLKCQKIFQGENFLGLNSFGVSNPYF